MRILFLTHAFNSLSQRLFVELQQLGHEVSIEFDVNDIVSLEAVELFQPDLIIAPFLKRAIDEKIWKNHTCLIVHPGIVGDRGPSALDWAIINQESQWGVTVLQANEEMDAGDIWASMEFPMRQASKASIYRNEVSEAAYDAIKLAIQNFSNSAFKPTPLANYKHAKGQLRPLITQTDRQINWQQDNSQRVLAKIHSADGFPGIKETLLGREVFLYNAHLAHLSEQPDNIAPGQIIAYTDSAICCTTVDGAIWIGHLRDKNSEHPFKLPAAQVLESELKQTDSVYLAAEHPDAFQEIYYEQEGEVGYLYFSFYNGAMSTRQCQQLLAAYKEAKQQDTKIIVLMGGNDFWSNGMHLNQIEAAESAADESWENINAIDDLALEIINTTSHITISALQANAGAGGVFLARAADEVWAHRSVILNPHYKDMGNLYGSEYWSYLLPRYVGEENVTHITQGRLPMGAEEALSLGLVNLVFDHERDEFIDEVKAKASTTAKLAIFNEWLNIKNARRKTDERIKPLAEYRQQELEKMRLNFYGFDPSYHVARYNFVYKIPKSRTPLTLAKHRRTSDPVKTAGSLAS